MTNPNLGQVANPRPCPYRVPSQPALEGAGGAPVRLAGYLRACRAVLVLIDQPTHGDVPNRRFRGRLLGAMYDRGEVHHFRVEDTDGQLYLVPPHWLVDPSELVAHVEAVP